MPKFNVEESIFVDVPVEKAYATVKDFKSWSIWSPWTIADPESKVKVAPDGTQYAWDWEIVGSGHMIIDKAEAGAAIYYTLTFLKPWKAVSPVSFLFEKEGDGTKITWTMEGSMPFFLFFMARMMGAFVAMDYERGLAMLKDHLELGQVPTKLDFVGVESFTSFPFIGIKTTCARTEVGEVISHDFEKLAAFFEENTINPGPAFSIYHKFDPLKNVTEFTAGMMVEAMPEDLPSEYFAGMFPACEAYKVQHTGPYRHLANAWSAGMMRGRAKVFKQNKKIHPFETYENDPFEVPEADLITNVYFPVQ